MDELDKIRSILLEHAGSAKSREVAETISERAFFPNHLYHDMGFASRAEFNAFMSEQFPTLAELKPAQKRWKKFLFDSIGSVAPACYSCTDTDACLKCDI